MSISFTPAYIGKLEIKNRFVKAATAENMALDTGEVSGDLIGYYERYAQLDLGLILTGHMYVQPNGKGHPKMTAICGDEFIPGLMRLTEAAHRHGTRIFVQLSHCGGQIFSGDAERVAPSPVKNPITGVIPRELRPEEVEELVAAFGDAALRAREAGFDGVHLHGAHGYLISEFNSPYGNRREDEWGGTPERRSRFLLRVVEDVRSKVGRDYPLSIKLGVEDDMEDGLKREEGARRARELKEAAIDAIEVSCGFMDPKVGSSRPVKGLKDEAYFLPLAVAVRETVGDLPLILVGGLKTPALMERMIEEGKADFISLGRSLIREPDFVHQIARGRKEAASCISCNQCRAGLGKRALRCYVEEPLTEEEKAQ